MMGRVRNVPLESLYQIDLIFCTLMQRCKASGKLCTWILKAVGLVLHSEGLFDTCQQLINVQQLERPLIHRHKDQPQTLQAT